MKFLFLLLLNLYLPQIILSEYDPNKAIAYAKRWALDRNPNTMIILVWEMIVPILFLNV